MTISENPNSIPDIRIVAPSFDGLPAGASSVNWKTLRYDLETNEPLPSQRRIIGVRTSDNLYRLDITYTNIGSLSISQHPSDGSESAVWVGDPEAGAIRKQKAISVEDRPFSFDDPKRINQAAELVISAMATDVAWRASMEIQKTSLNFLRNLRSILSTDDAGSLEAIAVLGDKLEGYIKRDYPQEFLDIADQMDQLGIAEIAPLPRFDRYGIDLTPEWIRQYYGQMVSQGAA